jgi:hypothetical protein
MRDAVDAVRTGAARCRPPVHAPPAAGPTRRRVRADAHAAGRLPEGAGADMNTATRDDADRRHARAAPRLSRRRLDRPPPSGRLAESGAGAIAAIADSSAARAAKPERWRRTALLADSLDALLDMELDGIVIATPSALHASRHRALERGLAVFCQKPLARTAPRRARHRRGPRADRLLGVDCRTATPPLCMRSATRCAEHAIGGCTPPTSCSTTRTAPTRGGPRPGTGRRRLRHRPRRAPRRSRALDAGLPARPRGVEPALRRGRRPPASAVGAATCARTSRSRPSSWRTAPCCGWPARGSCTPARTPSSRHVPRQRRQPRHAQRARLVLRLHRDRFTAGTSRHCARRRTTGAAVPWWSGAGARPRSQRTTRASSRGRGGGRDPRRGARPMKRAHDGGHGGRRLDVRAGALPRARAPRRGHVTSPPWARR